MFKSYSFVFKFLSICIHKVFKINKTGFFCIHFVIKLLYLIDFEAYNWIFFIAFIRATQLEYNTNTRKNRTENLYPGDFNNNRTSFNFNDFRLDAKKIQDANSKILKYNRDYKKTLSVLYSKVTTVSLNKIRHPNIYHYFFWRHCSIRI